MIDTYDYGNNSRAQSTDRSYNTESTKALITRGGSPITESIASRPSMSRGSCAASSQLSALPSVRTSALQSDISQSSKATSAAVNGHASNTSESPKLKFTDGKGFLHYAQPIEMTEAEKNSARHQDDNVSTASSFKMDADILSLENAEYAMQMYNCQYVPQIRTD